MSTETRISNPEPTDTSRKRVLIVDDDDAIGRIFAKTLRAASYTVVRASNGLEAARLLETTSFDVIISDISMPSMSGIELLKAVRIHDADVPVVLVTGEPQTESAITAVEYRALRYLVKPVQSKELLEVVAEAMQSHETATMSREALPLLTERKREAARNAELEAHFHSALEQLFMVFQPILRPARGEVLAYEALVRTEEKFFAGPLDLLQAAEDLNAVDVLGRHVRSWVAEAIDVLDPGVLIFVNVHPLELLDDELYADGAPLSKHARRVVFEITERACLEKIENLDERLHALRAKGFRFAVDDLGSGYAGLTSFIELAPEFAKIDMELVRDVDKSRPKKRLIESLVEACATIDVELVCEGVETLEEADALRRLGVGLFQGYLFSAPQRSVNQALRDHLTAQMNLLAASLPRAQVCPWPSN